MLFSSFQDPNPARAGAAASAGEYLAVVGADPVNTKADSNSELLICLLMKTHQEYMKIQPSN